MTIIEKLSWVLIWLALAALAVNVAGAVLGTGEWIGIPVSLAAAGIGLLSLRAAK